jgi:hypothetical protein
MTTRLGRRQLFILIGALTIPGCARQDSPPPQSQQPSEATVRLIVDGMI